jgi:hypothetical protein
MLDVSRFISMIGKIRVAGFTLTRELELRCANITFDETERSCAAVLCFLRAVKVGRPCASEQCRDDSAWTCRSEQYCRMMDLYFSFSKALAVPSTGGDVDKREEVPRASPDTALHLRTTSALRRCGSALP